jgi:hypothetical protein
MSKSKENESTALAVQGGAGYLALANPETASLADEMNGLEVSPTR